MSVPETTLESLKIAARAAETKQAEQISAADVAARIGITDAFLFASAGNERQVLAVTQEIIDQLNERQGLKPLRREGESEGRWVLLDYGDFVVHIQHEEERGLYGLDRLWSDAPQIDLELTEANSN